MKKYFFIVFITLSCIAGGYTQSTDALSIIKKIDANEIYSTIKYDAEMVIENSGKKYIKTMVLYGQGKNNSFITFTNQEDTGTKYLKKDGELFVYSPDSEEVIPITGHMLKESIMGSDMSYEDTVDNDTLESKYNPVIKEETVYEDKPVWILELTAKKKNISYPKEIMWVDKENYSVYKIEQYALSGAKLKEITNLDYKKIGSKFLPATSIVKDMLRKKSQTTFKMKNVEIDIKIPANIFSMQNLQK